MCLKDMNPLRTNKTILLNMKPIFVPLLHLGKTFLPKKLADAVSTSIFMKI